MVRRKTPVRHTVRSHIREGKPVRSFARGSGTSRRNPSKVVGGDKGEGVPHIVTAFARESDNYEDFVQRIRDHFYKPSRLGADVRVGEWIKFTPPEGKVKGAYRREPWYGSKSTSQYNDPSIMGEVIKVNPKTVRIKQTFFKESWNYNKEYIVPKTAKATRDLIQLLGKDDQWLEDIFEKVRS